jgi:Protein of unknown function (DUF4038)
LVYHPASIQTDGLAWSTSVVEVALIREHFMSMGGHGKIAMGDAAALLRLLTLAMTMTMFRACITQAFLSRGHAVKCRNLLALAALAGIGLYVPVRAADQRFPLSVSPTGRYLIDRQNQPFLVVGDSPWSLIVQPSPADVDHYLDDRKTRGFTAVLVNLLEHKFCTHPPQTRCGLAPFKKAGDFTTPNDDYFDYAAAVVKKAADRGIVVWLCPAYLGSKGGDEGWFQELKSSGPKAVRSYGRYVGDKFGSLPNIIWVLGGDFTPPDDSLWTVDAVAEGIREKDPNHLMTGHAALGPSAASAFPKRAWLHVNATYSYDPKLYVPFSPTMQGARYGRLGKTSQSRKNFSFPG